jgi:hypothetical protein
MTVVNAYTNNQEFVFSSTHSFIIIPLFIYYDIVYLVKDNCNVVDIISNPTYLLQRRYVTADAC